MLACDTNFMYLNLPLFWTISFTFVEECCILFVTIVCIYIFFHLLSVSFITVYTFLFTKLSFRDDGIGIVV